MQIPPASPEAGFGNVWNGVGRLVQSSWKAEEQALKIALLKSLKCSGTDAHLGSFHLRVEIAISHEILRYASLGSCKIVYRLEGGYYNHTMRIRIASILISVAIALAMLAAAPGNGRGPTGVAGARSRIRRLIVVVGENRSFDNVFGTYVPGPAGSSQTVWNLLSQGIVENNGSMGENFARAAQQRATDTITYELSPPQTSPTPAVLPQPSTTLDGLPVGPCLLAQFENYGDVFCSNIGLDSTSQGLLQAVGTAQPLYVPGTSPSPTPTPAFTPVPDCRYPSDLPNGPFSLVGASVLNNCGNPFLWFTVPNTTYTSNTGDPVHRFYQMWQQCDCSVANITMDNPSGCKGDLFTWVAITVGWGFTNPPMTDQDTYQGGVAMGFYNMAQGDFPYFLDLAENYAISDNYHQPVMGGTGPNSQFLFTGDVYYFTHPNGSPAMPAPNLIEDPNPRAGTNNFYNNDKFVQRRPG